MAPACRGLHRFGVHILCLGLLQELLVPRLPPGQPRLALGVLSAGMLPCPTTDSRAQPCAPSLERDLGPWAQCPAAVSVFPERPGKRAVEATTWDGCTSTPLQAKIRTRTKTTTTSESITTQRHKIRPRGKSLRRWRGPPLHGVLRGKARHTSPCPPPHGPVCLPSQGGSELVSRTSPHVHDPLIMSRVPGPCRGVQPAGSPRPRSEVRDSGHTARMRDTEMKWWRISGRCTA